MRAHACVYSSRLAKQSLNCRISVGAGDSSITAIGVFAITAMWVIVAGAVAGITA